MSMHAIESLVEYSVITTATASPVPPLAQSICYPESTGLRVHGITGS